MVFTRFDSVGTQCEPLAYLGIHYRICSHGQESAPCSLPAEKSANSVSIQQPLPAPVAVRLRPPQFTISRRRLRDKMNPKEHRVHKGFKLKAPSLRPLRLKSLFFHSKIQNQQSTIINPTLFVHGCFWHGHDNCPAFRHPKSRRPLPGAPPSRDRVTGSAFQPIRLLLSCWGRG